MHLSLGRLLQTILVVLVGGQVIAAPNAGTLFAAKKPTVLTYSAWKLARIDEAESVLARLENEKAEPKAGRPKADSRIIQMQQNLQIARELSVNDYFVLYLSQFPEREVLVEAARRMSPEEMADLMLSLRRSLAIPLPENQISQSK